jgi:hypothetical protein
MPFSVEVILSAFLEAALMGGGTWRPVFEILGIASHRAANVVEGAMWLAVGIALSLFGRRRARTLLRATSDRAKEEARALVLAGLASIPAAWLLKGMSEGIHASAIAHGLGCLASAAMVGSATSASKVPDQSWGARQTALLALALAFSALPGLSPWLTAIVTLRFLGKPMARALEAGALLAAIHALFRGFTLSGPSLSDLDVIAGTVVAVLAATVALALLQRRPTWFFRLALIATLCLGASLVLAGTIMGSVT